MEYTKATADDPQTPDELQALIAQKALQFLVHSFIYYRLDQNLIDDPTYDRLARELWTLRQAHPELPMPHQDLIDPVLGEEGSAYSLKEYPPSVITTAFQLLFAVQHAPAQPPQSAADLQAQNRAFERFVERHGYRCTWPSTQSTEPT